MVLSVRGTCGIVSSFRKIKGHNDRTEKVLAILTEVSFMILDLVHEFHMDSYRILWLLDTNLIQEDINHTDRNILGNCMLYCYELLLILILGLSVKAVGPRGPISAL